MFISSSIDLVRFVSKQNLNLKFMKVRYLVIRKEVRCTSVGAPKNCWGSAAPVQRTGATGGSYGPVCI